MRYGKKTVDNLKEKTAKAILQDIVSSCRLFAGDSYEEFGREVTEELIREKLIAYGKPLVLYHCTHKNNLASIYSEGLKPGCPANWDGMSMENKVYFSFDPEVAFDYAMNSSKAEEMGWQEEDFVILEYAYDCLDPKLFSYDWNNRCEYSDDINSVAYEGVVRTGAMISYGTIQQMRETGATAFTLEDFKDTDMYERVMNTFEEEVETNKERED